MHWPALPSRSKLAQSVAMTQSNFWPRFGFWNKPSGSRNLYFCGTASSFQQATFLPSFCNASARPSCEPMQSPSGRMWPTMQKVLLFADGFENAVNDFGIAFHDLIGSSVIAAGVVFSSSSMICSTRLPRTMESSKTNFSVGVYFKTMARATRPWMRMRCSVSNLEAALLLVGDCRGC